MTWQNILDHVEPDFASAAEAWLVIEMTKETLRHREECIRIATEFERRLTEERSQDTKGEA